MNNNFENSGNNNSVPEKMPNILSPEEPVVINDGAKIEQPVAIPEVEVEPVIVPIVNPVVVEPVAMPNSTETEQPVAIPEAQVEPVIVPIVNPVVEPAVMPNSTEVEQPVAVPEAQVEQL
jgi:hypothetical protein